ncbi:Ribonuclease P protein subunit p30 [Dissostichus eleginoides]|uniref:Ribonuclease P protein subunit p30 n=1 Tax=Dissostichus eleginoides TaxID=100907 RepID=A0AAD9BC28_DISEL|nr:Ribonuclease P protein subunit p30 [Dissostichus eleginoides]
MICDVDIICISVTEKLPFFFKRAPVNGRSETTRRRYTIANSTALMESCRGRNVILSSAAETVTLLQPREPSLAR